MSVKTYLPSAQFMVMAGALALSGTAVAAAQYYTTAHQAPNALVAPNSTEQAQWQESLEQVQAQSGVALPDAPSGDALSILLTEAESENITDSIGRQLLVRLTNAGVQGLGSDIPTQEGIIAEAVRQMNASRPAPKQVSPAYVEASDLSQRTYGNEVMRIFARHPKASSEATLLTIGEATDTQNPAPLAGLAPIGAAYSAMADELAGLAVPQTLGPLHVQVVQNIYAIAATYPDMAKVVEDPLRGVAALQEYQLKMSEVGRLLTNIAGALKKSGILFTKDEPGVGWETFLSAS